MAEYIANALQTVALNSPIVFDSSIPCNRGLVYHEDGTGNFILKGSNGNSTCNCFAQYQVTFNGNIAIPEEGEVTPIAVALVVNGEQRPSSRAIFTPAETEEFGNVTSTAIIKVPRCCCFNLGVEYVSGIVDDPTTTPTPVIDVINANLTIARIA